MSKPLAYYQDRIETALDTYLSDGETPEILAASMRYSTLGAGKRVRAMLVYGAGLAMNAPLNALDSTAASLECIHAYSLIHDDLPAMDDDDLRRGKPTNHIKYDEATAILAGDALQTLAFELIANEAALSDAQARHISRVLSQSSGRVGMVGGQMLDMLATEQQLDQAQLENVHRRKTGALIRAAVLCGALCASHVEQADYQALDEYAQKLGLAFQVIDDVLDIESTTEELGKTSGADVAQGKSTYPALLGLAQSKNLARTLYDEAHRALGRISGDTSMLAELAVLVVNRRK